MDKNKKSIIIISIVVVILIIVAVVVGVYLYFSNQPKNNPEDVVNTYSQYIVDQNYEQMYNLISENSKSKISKEDYINRNKNIYEGIEIANFSINVTSVEKAENKTVKVNYDNSMDTMAGHIDFSNTMTLELDNNKEYKINWSSNLIFPNLNTSDKVRVKTLEAKRGSILDRNGNFIATNGTASQIGLVPGKINEQTKDSDIAQIAQLLNITVDTINDSLSKSYVKDDTFVPLKTVSKNETDLKNELLKISGVKIIDSEERIYPLGESVSQLVGYIQPISAEELEEKADEGYTSTSLIGKYGLERYYEDKLRSVNGAEIYIEDEDGNKKETLAKIDAKDGEDVKLTIDGTLQQEIYEQFKQDESAVVEINPKTGEILALVSCPSFDSNDFSLGMSTADYNSLTENTQNLLFNRYLATYAPGSSFKPIVGAIGLSTGSFTAEEDFGTSGRRWQNDSSWGDFYITTLTSYSGPANLRNALIYSDNIYFAKAALKIGSDKFIQSLKNLGFNENIEFPQTISKSTYSNSDGFTNETQLANSGYGQGEVLVNPIHMAMMYSAFVNEGNMIMPYIEYKDNATATYYKEEVFTKEAADTVRDDLIQVVENPDGTAHSAKIEGKTIAGKTGTAEVKASKDDTEGTEVGWFNAFTVGESDENSRLIISMVENVKGKGGSHYLLPKVKSILE